MLLGENGAVVTVGLLVKVLSPEISGQLLGSPALLVRARDGKIKQVRGVVSASLAVLLLAYVVVPASMSVVVSISVAASRSVAVSEATLGSRFEAASLFLRTSVSTTASTKVVYFRLGVEA